ncbi:MAG: hypothetical protein ACI8UO_001383 [Verrucomicrobiales bacterium]|jgi:hypothetical protein
MSATLKTVDATIEPDGSVRLLEPIQGPAKAVVTVLIDEPVPDVSITDLEKSLDESRAEGPIPLEPDFFDRLRQRARDAAEA